MRTSDEYTVYIYTVHSGVKPFVSVYSPANMPRPARSKASRTPLSRDSLLDLAELVLARDGMDALTMRRLAAGAGATAMALYNHFENREELLDALVERLFARLPMPARTGPWKTRIATLGRTIVQNAQASPALYRLAMTRPNKPASAVAVREYTIDAFKDAGLTPPQAAQAYAAVAMFLRGLILFEVERHCAPTDTPAHAGYPPALALFESGIGYLLDGIAAQAAGNRAVRPKARRR